MFISRRAETWLALSLCLFGAVGLLLWTQWGEFLLLNYLSFFCD
jgi:hypothetical protein